MGFRPWDAGQVGSRAWDAGQVGCRTRGIQDRRDAEKEGYRTGGMHDRWFAGQVGCRKIVRPETGKERAGKEESESERKKFSEQFNTYRSHLVYKLHL